MAPHPARPALTSQAPPRIGPADTTALQPTALELRYQNATDGPLSPLVTLTTDFSTVEIAGSE